MIWRVLLVLTALLPWLLLHWIFADQTPASRVFLNANIISMDATDNRYQAVAVKHGRIKALGSNDDMRQHIRANTIVSDLDGATLLPGFIDAHSHFPSNGLKAIVVDVAPPPIGTTSTIDVLLQQISDYIEREKPGNNEWIIGFGYDDSSLAERRHPTRTELDGVSSSLPIYLWHSSGHMGVANSRALELLNIDEWTEAPPGGVIVLDLSTGLPSGLLMETAAPSTARLLRNRPLLDYWHIMQHAVDDYATHGITTAQAGGINLTTMRALKAASLFKLLPFRLNVWPKHHAVGEALLNGEINLSRYNDSRFQIGPVKILADGSPQGRTAYLTKPYHTNPPDRPDERGFPSFTRDALTDIVQRYHQADIPMAIHGNGDAAIDDILHAFENAQAKSPADDPRLVLVHAQMARRDQLPAMKKLGITPSFFSNHTYFWGDAHFNLHMGPQRAPAISPAASARAIGLRYSIHTDAPVTPIDPIQLISSAVERRSTSGRIIGEHERISVIDALRAITIEAAWQMQQEHDRGSIEVGKLADFVVLNEDPTRRDSDFSDVAIEETIVGGRTIYRR